MEKRKGVFSSFFFFYYCCDHIKKDNLVDAYFKHQQIKEEVFLFNNQNVILILLSIVKVEVPWWSCTLGMD